MTNNARKPTMQATPTHLRHHSALCIEFMADDPSSARWHDWHATATRVVAALGGQLGPLGGGLMCGRFTPCSALADRSPATPSTRCNAP